MPFDIRVSARGDVAVNKHETFSARGGRSERGPQPGLDQQSQTSVKEARKKRGVYLRSRRGREGGSRLQSAESGHGGIAALTAGVRSPSQILLSFSSKSRENEENHNQLPGVRAENQDNTKEFCIYATPLSSLSLSKPVEYPVLESLPRAHSKRPLAHSPVLRDKRKSTLRHTSP